MSSKSSLFLTIDNEHCYEECNSPIYKENEFKGYEIVLEIDPKNGTCEIDKCGNISIYLNDPESEIYKLMMMLKDKEALINSKETNPPPLRDGSDFVVKLKENSSMEIIIKMITFILFLLIAFLMFLFVKNNKQY